MTLSFTITSHMQKNKTEIKVKLLIFSRLNSKGTEILQTLATNPQETGLLVLPLVQLLHVSGRAVNSQDDHILAYSD